MKMGRIAAAGLALLMLGGCGRGEEQSGQPSADEREKVDNIAAKLDGEQTFDTSPDSLVPADENAVAGNNAVAPITANQAAPAPGNQAAPPAAANQARRN
jgi:hypothetical protein